MFSLAQRTGFHDAHGIADVAFLFLVMSHKTAGFLDKLAVNRVFLTTLDLHDDGFLHLVADNHADSFFSKISFHFSASFNYLLPSSSRLLNSVR